MSLVLARIDDRLIHGQVVEGWLRVIEANRIVVACDEAAGDPFQVSLMRLAVPADVEVVVTTVQEAADALNNGRWASDRVLLLLSTIQDARRLVEAGAKLSSLNLGGLRAAPGRQVLAPYLALSQMDRSDIEMLLARKVAIEVRPLPTDEKKPVQDFIKNFPPKGRKGPA